MKELINLDHKLKIQLKEDILKRFLNEKFVYGDEYRNYIYDLFLTIKENEFYLPFQTDSKIEYKNDEIKGEVYFNKKDLKEHNEDIIFILFSKIEQDYINEKINYISKIIDYNRYNSFTLQIFNNINNIEISVNAYEMYPITPYGNSRLIRLIDKNKNGNYTFLNREDHNINNIEKCLHYLYNSYNRGDSVNLHNYYYDEKGYIPFDKIKTT